MDGRWRLMLDYPFDPDNQSAAQDRIRVLELRAQVGNRPAVAWLPGSSPRRARQARQADQGQLPARRPGQAREHTRTIGPEDRRRAHDLLRNLQSSLRSELRTR
ncbi:hypothetical protein K7G98_16990 [Saccharothrix sp. MB29]|nr:hypothetical protein [Saccharothrix sp. MB29]